MSTFGFSIDALLTKDTSDMDDVLSGSELSKDTLKKTTVAPLAADWLSYARSNNGQMIGGAHRQLRGLPLHGSYDSPRANPYYSSLLSEYDSGFGSGSVTGGASASDVFWNDKSDGRNASSSNCGRDSSLDLERRRLSPVFGNTLTGPARLDHSTGAKDDEEDEEDRMNLMRSSTGHVQRRRTTMTHFNSTITAHQSTKLHAEGSAGQQQQALPSSTLRRPWEEEKFESSSLATSTPTSNASIRRPWEVSPVHNIQPLDVSADNHSYMEQVSRDSGYPSFGTQSTGQFNMFQKLDNAPTRDASQEVDNSQETNHIDTKRVQKPSRTNTIFSDETVEVMETWYVTNYDKPYPTEEQIHLLSTRARLTVRQARKWLANRRVRSHNTLAYNNNVHPKRARRLERNRQAMLGLAASLSQNNIEAGGAQIQSLNVPLTPATTHHINNSMNRGREISANIHGTFSSRAPALHAGLVDTRMDDTSLSSRISHLSGLPQSESYDTTFGYHQRPQLNWSTSTLNSSLQNELFDHQHQEQQQRQQQQQRPFMSFGDLLQPELAAPPKYLPYSNYLDKQPRH